MRNNLEISKYTQTHTFIHCMSHKSTTKLNKETTEILKPLSLSRHLFPQIFSSLQNKDDSVSSGWKNVRRTTIAKIHCSSISPLLFWAHENRRIWPQSFHTQMHGGGGFYVTILHTIEQVTIWQEIEMFKALNYFFL